MDRIFFHDDPLSGLTEVATFRERLAHVHNALRHRCPGIDRMAIALHDRQSGMLKTFTASPAEENPLRNYEVSLADARSLNETAAARRPRVVNDLEVFADSKQEHSRR